jgi:hypothetical protein
MEKCPAHDEMLREVAATTEAVNTLKLETTKIFDLLRPMSADLTEALTRAQFREDAIAEIDNKIENGLKSSVAALTIQVTQMVSCNERRRKERELEKEKGVGGFFRKGWDKFKAQASFIIITFLILGSISAILWGLSKIGIFREGPFWLLKFFGLGG